MTRKRKTDRRNCIEAIFCIEKNRLTPMFTFGFFFTIVLFCLRSDNVNCLKVTVFGASGGIGQLVCNRLLKTTGIESVKAVSRNIDSLNKFDLLNGCEFVQADALNPDSLLPSVVASDCLVISVGTTAFPSDKWKNGNNPRAACVDTVQNIFNAIEISGQRPKKVILLSSIGVERADTFPFKILNAYGVLDAKRDSEKLLFDRADKLGFDAVVVRPGRLIGAPFTNFDIAKLFNIDQKSNNVGITIDKREILSGDVRRIDVANAVCKVIMTQFVEKKVLFSIINSPGIEPNDMEWGKLLSLFTVPEADILNTRTSSIN